MQQVFEAEYSIIHFPIFAFEISLFKLNILQVFLYRAQADTYTYTNTYIYTGPLNDMVEFRFIIKSCSYIDISFKYEQFASF